MGPPTAYGRPAQRLKPCTSKAAMSTASLQMRGTICPRRRRVPSLMRFLRFRNGKSVEASLLRKVACRRNRLLDARHHLFRHQDHRLAAEFAVLPVLAGIKQRAEGADLFLERQQLVGNAFRR